MANLIPKTPESIAAERAWEESDLRCQVCNDEGRQCYYPDTHVGDHLFVIPEATIVPNPGTVEEYLYKHAVLDGLGNMDGLFVPLSVAHLACEQMVAGKLKLETLSSHREQK